MKREAISLIVLAMVIGFGQKLQAQYYLKFDMGYAAPMGEQSVPQFFDFNEESETLPFKKQNKISLGQGSHFNLGLGYNFSGKIGAELNLSYLWGSKRDSEIETSDDYFYRSLRGEMFSAIPSLVLIMPIKKPNMDFYSRVGLITSISSRMIYDTETLIDSNNADYQQRYIMSGSFALGFNAVMGLKWKKGKVNYFVELDYRALSYAPTKRSMQTSTINGSSNIHALSVHDRETVYLENIEVSNPAIVNDEEPLEVLISAYPFSSVGLNFGISINL